MEQAEWRLSILEVWHCEVPGVAWATVTPGIGVTLAIVHMDGADYQTEDFNDANEAKEWAMECIEEVMRFRRDG